MGRSPRRNEPRKQPEEQETCSPEFLFNRRKDAFYNIETGGRVTKQRACDKPLALSVPRTLSIPIYWANLSTGANSWDKPSITAKVDEAKTFFERYCITLQIEEVPVNNREVVDFDQRFRLNNPGPDDAARIVRDACEALRVRKGSPDAVVFVLFVGNFGQIRYGDRVDDISGCFARFKCALIESVPDKQSPNILTHELIHALGQEQGAKLAWSIPGADQKENTWNHGSCIDHDMGNVPRTNPANPVNLAATRLLDFAAWVQFYKYSKTIKDF
jgi:hypothetical protein